MLRRPTSNPPVGRCPRLAFMVQRATHTGTITSNNRHNNNSSSSSKRRQPCKWPIIRCQITTIFTTMVRMFTTRKCHLRRRCPPGLRLLRELALAPRGLQSRTTFSPATTPLSTRRATRERPARAVAMSQWPRVRHLRLKVAKVSRRSRRSKGSLTSSSELLYRW